MVESRLVWLDPESKSLSTEDAVLSGLLCRESQLLRELVCEKALGPSSLESSIANPPDIYASRKSWGAYAASVARPRIGCGSVDLFFLRKGMVFRMGGSGPAYVRN